MPQRYAIYYAPAADAPLWRAVTQWLGRDPADATATGGEIAGLDRELLSANSVSANRYGFHATIKAPMTLAEGVSLAELEAALAAFGAVTAPVSIGQLQPALIEGFLALIPAAQTPELTAFAGEVVETFDRFRAPMSVAERERRTKGGTMSARQAELLEQFGYPYVFEEFRFHMTLTDRLAEGLRGPMQAAAKRHFGPLLDNEVMLDRLVVFGEPEPGAPFVRLSEFELKAGR
jgi:putative phosphonate metabolism protein